MTASHTRADPPTRALSIDRVIADDIAWHTGSQGTTGLGLPGLFAVVRLIASAIDQLPLTATRGPLPRWMEQPRRMGAAFDLGDAIQHCVVDMALSGAGYFVVQRMTTGYRMDTVRSDQISVQRSSTGPAQLLYHLDGQPIERLPYWEQDRGTVPYLLPIPYLVVPEFPQGVSPVTLARVALQGYSDVEMSSAGLLSNGTAVGGRLETDNELTQQSAERLQNSWIQARKTGRIPILTSGLRYAESRLNMSDAQFLESRAFNQTQIASMYGVPNSYVGTGLMTGQSSLSYSNSRDNQRLFRTNCLAHFTRQIEDAFSELLSNGRNASEADSVRFDWSEWENAGGNTPDGNPLGDAVGVGRDSDDPGSGGPVRDDDPAQRRQD